MVGLRAGAGRSDRRRGGQQTELHAPGLVHRGVEHLVAQGHRGHRLGLGVKVAVTRTLCEQFPAKRFVTTTNAETNAHMVAINVALGFEITHVHGDFQKRLV